MFGLFKSPAHSDGQLGRFSRRGGLWHGSIALAGAAPVPLALSGDRAAPDAAALAAARELPGAYAGWQPSIAAALLEHARPYLDAQQEEGAEGLPRLSAPGDVWPHAVLRFVSVAPLGGAMTVELGYSVAWDEEHTLGARLRDGRLVELNGSALPP